MTNFSGENLNAARGGPQGGGMESRRNGVAEVSSKYLTEGALSAIRSGYKKTEVGVIPEDWEVQDFGSLFQSTVSKKAIKPGTLVSFVGMQDVTERAQLADQHLIPIENVRSGFTYFERDDVLIAKITPCFENGKGCHTELLHSDIGFGSTEFHVLRANDISDSRFIYYWSNREVFRKSLEPEMVGSAGHRRVPLSAISNYQIPVPPKAEQTAIANALSDVDALISELEKLIAKKQAIKTATMQQLLTGRTRLPQFALRDDGTPKGTKPSELGEIPEDWEVVAMGDLGSTYGGLSGKSKQDFGHGNSLYVPFTNVMANVVVDVDNLEKVDVREAQNNLALGDLLFNGSSETPEEVCFSALVSADIRKLYLNSFCFGFRSNQKNAYLPLYLAYWFRSEVGRAAVLVMAQGSTRYNISKSQFMKLTIVLPDTEEQTAIATIVSDMDAEIQALEQRLGKTRQIKQGMMQELLTGKTRLPYDKE